MRVINPEELETRAPAGHFDVVTRRLISKEIGATKLRISQGVIQPGGGSIRHTHEDSEQCFYILRGELTVTSEQGSKTIHTGMIAWTPAGEGHEMRNNGKEDTHYLSITAPP